MEPMLKEHEEKLVDLIRSAVASADNQILFSKRDRIARAVIEAVRGTEAFTIGYAPAYLQKLQQK